MYQKHGLNLTGEFQESPAHRAFKFKAERQSISNRGNPDGDQHGILGGPLKGLDL